MLVPLRRRLERDGFIVRWPGFSMTTFLCEELRHLLAVLDEVGEAVIVGHSAGGLLAVLAAQSRHPNVKAVIGLGTPLLGRVKIPVPYYEARSLLGWAAPLDGASEVKRFLTTHALLPLMPSVQNWISQKIKERA